MNYSGMYICLPARLSIHSLPFVDPYVPVERGKSGFMGMFIMLTSITSSERPLIGIIVCDDGTAEWQMTRLRCRSNMARKTVMKEDMAMHSDLVYFLEITTTTCTSWLLAASQRSEHSFF